MHFTTTRTRRGGLSLLISVLAVGLAGLGSVYATEFQFAQTYVDTNYGGNGRPGWVQAADMDGDGDLDIVAGGGQALYIYENNGQSSGWQRRGNLDGTGSIGANGGVLFDVDGDGDPDVVSAKYNSDLGWWANPGGALTNTAWTFHRLDGGDSGWFLHDIMLGDLDRDGKAEEFVCVLLNGYWDAPYHIFWYRPTANPTANWEKHVVTQNHAGANHNHAGLDLADLDADGDIDLSFSDGWFESSGNPGGSWSWHDVTNIYGISNSLARDVDRDGDLDLVMSGGHHGQGVFWFENDGTPQSGSWVQHNVAPTYGGLTARRYYAAGVNYLHHPEGLQVEDIDGDGDLDILACELFFGEDTGEPDWSEQKHNLYIYENTGGSPPQWNEQNIAPNSYPSHLPFLIDINQDGKLDLISESAGHGVVSYYENQTVTATPEISFDRVVVDGSYPGNGRPGWSASGDIDGDGAVDVVSGGGGAIQWYEAPNWSRHTIQSNSNAGGNGGVVTDVDRDGDLDVVSARYSESLVWWENPGGGAATGTWSSHVIDSASAAQNFNHDLVYGDIDGDGEGEFAALYIGGGIYWYDVPQNPKVDSWPRTRVLTDINDPYVGLALGDLDRDGDLDIVAANKWYERPADPSSSDWTARTVFSGAVQNVFCHDVDKDGRLDVVAAEGFTHPNGRVLWAQAPADPRTQSWTVSTVGTGLDGPENIWAGDLDRDGMTDIVSGEMGTETGWNDSDSNLIVFEGQDAAGQTWNQNVVASNVGVSARINAVDIDGDGDTDFTADGNAENHIYLWVNTTPTGGGPPPPPQPPAAPGNLVAD